MKDWETAYREKGEVQKEVVDIVRDSVKLFRRKGVKKVLDVGFGTGRHTIFLAENGFEVYGIDISRTGKGIVEKKLKERSLGNVHLTIADMHKLPFKNNSFDAIVAVHVLPHDNLDGLRGTVSELQRVLKPKGVLVATLLSVKDSRYGTGRKVAPDTFSGFDDPDESDVPHHFSDEKEAKELLAEFDLIKLEEKFMHSERRKATSVHWQIIAEKR
jgi:ubiquinone/menaquinone biosynthesis C-methylase UbiE